MKKIIEIIPVLTAALLYLGYCHIYYYYDTFGVNIYSYVSSSELLLLFLPTLIYSTGVILIGLTSNLIKTFLDNYNQIERERNTQEENAPSTLTPSNTQTSNSKWSVFLRKAGKFIFNYFQPPVYGAFSFLFLSFAITQLIMSFYQIKNYQLKEIFLFIDIIFLFLIFNGLLRYKEYLKRNILLIITFMIFYIGKSIIGSYRVQQAQEIMDGYAISNVSFQYNNHKIVTTSSLLYIGQTEQYLFLYNRTNKSIPIFKMENVDSLVVQKIAKH
ncbi:hypothetical protein [Xanthocytophaga agilis]|uniref:Uncharacterized protein n=1 Tax=Xanthocytophaga agilis TaxID=3048010 RepID=A0AAE3UDT0_9BACT|nr:hypothetical protein [Xanthocytophaga agilis]MDJ1500656.1 hypothetical protein [Xanthocytophaga agilis]